LLPGVADLSDDYDDVSDFFTADQLSRMPVSNQQMDIQMLATLSPERVRSDFRMQNYDQVWDIDSIAARCKVEGLSIVEYLSADRSDDETPFTCGYTVLVPESSLSLLKKERYWNYPI
jgi:hypothetical protein